MTTLLRVVAGPLVLAGFFLPWVTGPGMLAANRFSGYDLVGFTGRLRALQLDSGPTGALWATQALILAVAVAAAWMTMLAPLGRSQWLYRASGWYVVLMAGAAVSIGLLTAGITAPPMGLALWIAGATAFALTEPRLLSAAGDAARSLRRSGAAGGDLRTDLSEQAG